MQPPLKKILIISDSAAIASGMAETIRLLFETLLDLYPSFYRIEQVGLFHIYAVTEPRWTVHPTRVLLEGGKRRLHPGDYFGHLTYPEVIQSFNPDIVYAFNDPQHLFHIALQPRDGFKLVTHINYDGLPAPYANTPLQSADAVITTSNFSRSIFLETHQNIEARNVFCVYSPCDSSRFFPRNRIEREKVKSDLLPPYIPKNSFVLGWIGRNQWRKQNWIIYKLISIVRKGGYAVCDDCNRVTTYEWNAVNKAFKYFNTATRTRSLVCGRCGSERITSAEALPQIVLWCHMATDDPVSTWPVSKLEFVYGLEAGKDVYYTEGHTSLAKLSPEGVSTLISCFDALLFLSGGEGFGNPAWEAMASGVPVIYTSYSSHAEFLDAANAGIPVGGIFQPEPPDCVLRLIASIDEAVEAVRFLYFNPQSRDSLGDAGAKYTRNFTARKQAELLHNIFQGLYL